MSTAQPDVVGPPVLEKQFSEMTEYTEGAEQEDNLDLDNELFSDLYDASEREDVAPSQKFDDARARYRCNPFCRLMFCWLDPLFWTGCRNKGLQLEDLYSHPEEVDSKDLLKRFNRSWQRGAAPSLLFVLIKCLWTRILLNGVLLFLDVALQIGLSVVLGYITDYFSIENPSYAETRNAYFYASGMVVMVFCLTFIYAHSSVLAQKTGMIARIMTSGAVFQKVLELDPVTLAGISTGHLLNIASNDVQRFDFAFLFLHYLWISPLHITVYTYLVYKEVGPAAFAGTAFVVLQIPLQFLLARLYVHLRIKSALLTDRRVKVMNEVISGMRVIKMYAWEHAFVKVVNQLRRSESFMVLKSSLIRAVNFAVFSVSLTALMFLVFSVYINTGGVLTPKKVFTVLSLTATLRVNAIHFLVLCTLGLSEVYIAIKRIQDLLEMPIAAKMQGSTSMSLQSEVLQLKQCPTSPLDFETDPTTDNTSSDTVPSSPTLNPFEASPTPFEAPPTPFEAPPTPFEAPPTPFEAPPTPPVHILASHAAVSYRPADPSKVAPAIDNPTKISPGTAGSVDLGNPTDTNGSGPTYDLTVDLGNPTDTNGSGPTCDLTVHSQTIPILPKETTGSLVMAKNLSASWTYSASKLVISGVTLEVNEQSPFLAMVGSVGSGKSTLLQCILGELRPLQGSLSVVGRVSYASQEPWLFSGTIRENILFGQPFQAAWYHNVMEACALSKDIHHFPLGDMTVVGENGVTLSGGQKARISLARAVYYDADIYLLDDPLSAVDTAVAKHIVEKCILTLLQDRLVLLATHQLQFAQAADRILGLKNGAVIAYCTPNELRAKALNANFLGLTQVVNADGEFSYKSQSSQSTPPKQYPMRFIKNKQEIQKYLNERRPSVMTTIGEYLRGPIHFSTADGRLASGSSLSIYSSQTTLQTTRSMQSIGKDIPPEGTHLFYPRAIIMFYKYFSAGANNIGLLILLVMFLAGEGSNIVADWWISKWTENRSDEAYTGSSELIGIYGGITSAAVLLNFARIILMFWVTINAAQVLHNKMFLSVMRAPIRFFDFNTTGNILNYFTKDIGLLDDLLPFMLCEYLILLLRCLAVFVTTAIANYWIILAVVGLLVVLVVLRHYFLITAKEVKRLEAEARSPLYSHIVATIQGLPTIRTFKQQSNAIDTFHLHQDHHSQAWYLYLVTTRWFGIRVDLLNAVFLATVAFISISISSGSKVSFFIYSAGISVLLGLGLTYTVTLTGMLQYCVRLSGEVESVMVSAERVMEYSMLEPEASLETPASNERPPPGWPQQGEIVLEDASFQYSPSAPPVLKSLCCTIRSGEKVGIVGRTGAGKSSLIHMLFRMAEPMGCVLIDGIDITSVGLHDLRKHISIIPQDPVLFSGTVRYNLDPFGEYDDTRLWNVLEQVQLMTIIESLGNALDSEISEGGSNFSVGQRQLICLARALLRKNKILILDEATANVDIKTDGIIQSAIRESFSECTVLTIAHRLNTIMDYDRIMVLKTGRIKEFDEPITLLNTADSLFWVMVERTGPVPASKLKQLAQEAHNRKRAGRRHPNVHTMLPIQEMS